MSKETLEELKAIISSAPDENLGEELFVNASDEYILFADDYFYKRVGDEWVMCGRLLPCYGLRSLSDIERIIELMELNQNMHTTVAGYLWGKDWAHWNEFNAGKFKL